MNEMDLGSYMYKLNISVKYMCRYMILKVNPLRSIIMNYCCNGYYIVEDAVFALITP